MLTNCRKSCDLHDDKCKYWAERGVCENNPAYMLRNCQRSCSRQGTINLELGSGYSDKKQVIQIISKKFVSQIETQPSRLEKHCE